jgi:hypothetical protein
MPMRSAVPDYATTAALIQATAPPVASGPLVGPLPLLAQSVMAYVGFFGAIASMVLVGWRAGKEKSRMEAHEKATNDALDGFGGRVESLEAEVQAMQTSQTEWLRSLERVLASNESLVRDVARSQKAAEDCDSHAEGYFISIGSKLDALIKELNEARRVDGERLKAVETRLNYPQQRT